jgi:hypothetical protein
LYVANADEHGVASTELRGTTQNDIVKEYLSRGTYIFPPAASRRLIVDMVAWCADSAPSWNPMNVCSYHLQEAGATPVQEIAYSMATAIGVLDAVRDSGQVDHERFGQVFGSISFFVNAGIRFVEEICKLRAMTEMWDRIGAERYGVTDAKARRFRYGVQVNSLGLTEAQPENNVQRIVLEMLGVTMSKRARARAQTLRLAAVFTWRASRGIARSLNWGVCGSLAAPRVDERCGNCRGCRFWPSPHRVHWRGLRETSDSGAILDVFCELCANALCRAGFPLGGRGGTGRALAGYVATQRVPTRRVGHRS